MPRIEQKLIEKGDVDLFGATCGYTNIVSADNNSFYLWRHVVAY